VPHLRGPGIFLKSPYFGKRSPQHVFHIWRQRGNFFQDKLSNFSFRRPPTCATGSKAEEKFQMPQLKIEISSYLNNSILSLELPYKPNAFLFGYMSGS